jgi:hypothetical protein
MSKTYKSSEYINESDEDITSPKPYSNSSSSSGSSTVIAGSDLLSARNSIDRELDAMNPIPTPAPEPLRDPSLPPKQVAKA